MEADARKVEKHFCQLDVHPFAIRFGKDARLQCSRSVKMSDSCGVRTHALSEWRLEPPP